jgi:uncharacterized protein Yka (UPF0111/DUF47 family)
MSEKTRIVAALGEFRLQLPALLNEALAANDRAKFRLTLLQTAKAHADAPEVVFNDLHIERLSCGIVDSSYDNVVAGTVMRTSDNYEMPLVSELCSSLHGDIMAMIAPFEAAQKTEARLYQQRLERLSPHLWSGKDSTITGESINSLTLGTPDHGDSVHLLIMDMHRSLNRLQAEIATDNVDGALTYGLRAVERSLVVAFMKGVNRTKSLKFDHPGLGTTATRAGATLIIQNDIGTTDAHVLVIHVERMRVTVTYTDNHLPRLLFFQEMFTGWDVKWGNVQSHTDKALENGVYHLCVGAYTARDKTDQKAYLTHLGSRLVFLIDWNRARKRLQVLVPRQDAISLLSWAAANDVGHMAFVKAGGERMIIDALHFVAGGTLSYGATLDELLGKEAAGSFMRFILKECSRGLLNKRPLALIRDEARVELYKYYHNAQQKLLDLVSNQASLSVEIAASIRDGLLGVSRPDGLSSFERIGLRSKEWERKADEMVITARELAKQSEQADAVRQLLEVADDITDELEEAAFHLSLLEVDGLVKEIRLPLASLARLLVEGTQEYLKAIENARGILRSGSPDDMHDFLESIHRIVAIEQQSDMVQREVNKALVSASKDFRQVFVIAECAKKMESAADALMHTGMILRDQMLGKIMGPV